MKGKRILAAKALMAFKLHKLLKRPAKNTLFIVNFHRIKTSSDGLASEFDEGVFGSDQKIFYEQMRWLKQKTQILGQADLLRLVQGKFSGNGPFAAVTFDDGYTDCFTISKPILDSLDIQAIFFIPVKAIEERQLGWWDISAYLLKKSRLSSIELNDRVYPLEKETPETLRQILMLFKHEPAYKTARLLQLLSDACEVKIPEQEKQSAELMTWGDIKKLLKSGHAIGSHTFTHRVLSTLDPKEQEQELMESKQFLEKKIDSEIVSLAYPVGGLQHFNEHTIALAQKTGYQMAFSFGTGFAKLPVLEKFAIPRHSLTGNLSFSQALILFPEIMGCKTT